VVIFYWTTVSAFVSLTLLSLWLEWRTHQGSALVGQLDRIERKLEIIMSDQDILNEYVVRLGTAVNAIKAEIDALKSQPAAVAVDFSGLDAAVSSVESLEPPAPAAE